MKQTNLQESWQKIARIRGYGTLKFGCGSVVLPYCCNRVFSLCGVAHAAMYRANAVSPCNFRKTIIALPFPNTSKTTFDVGKTMSYAGKIMSDIIQTTSDLFWYGCSILFSRKL